MQSTEANLNVFKHFYRPWVNGMIKLAVIGDCAGAPFELQRRVNQKQIDSCQKLQGGKELNFQAGEYTDDTTMALAYAYGLIAGEGNLDLMEITRSLLEWFESSPRGIGISTSDTLKYATLEYDQEQGSLDLKLQSALRGMRKFACTNQSKQPNGIIMSLNWVAVWCCRLDSIEEVMLVGRELSRIWVSNETALRVGEIYLAILWFCLRNHEDNKEAEGRKQKSKEAYNFAVSLIEASHDPVLDTWMKEFKSSWTVFEIPKHPNGWVKNALLFVLLYLFEEETDFERVVKEIISLGGDTDTHCAIVGAVLGAIYGEQSVQKFDFENIEKFNPKFVQYNFGLNYENLLARLASIAPTTLKIIGSEKEGPSSQQFLKEIQAEASVQTKIIRPTEEIDNWEFLEGNKEEGKAQTKMENAIDDIDNWEF